MIYQAPKLTKYGKITDLIQAGSVVIATGDVTGDGVADTLYDTDGDGKGDLVVGGANGGQTPVTYIGTPYGGIGLDADGDGKAGITIYSTQLNIMSIPYANGSSEPVLEDGWNDPARD